MYFSRYSQLILLLKLINSNHLFFVVYFKSLYFFLFFYQKCCFYSDICLFFTVIPPFFLLDSFSFCIVSIFLIHFNRRNPDKQKVLYIFYRFFFYFIRQSEQYLNIFMLFFYVTIFNNLLFLCSYFIHITVSGVYNTFL